MLKIGLIGLGGISQTVIDRLASMASNKHYKIVGVLVRSGSVSFPSNKTFLICQTAKELISLGPDVVAECASHSSVGAYGKQILAGGVKLILISIGAFAHDDIYCRPKNAAMFSGLEKVCYRARKLP